MPAVLQHSKYFNSMTLLKVMMKVAFIIKIWTWWVKSTKDKHSNINKKFGIMLTRRVKAYSMPMLIILQPFSRKTGQHRKNSYFCGGTVLWCPRAQVSLNLENPDLDCWNLRSMLKISYIACPCLSQLVSTQFAFEMCLAARNRQKIHKNRYFSIQGHPRSLNSVAIESQCMTCLLYTSDAADE